MPTLNKALAKDGNLNMWGNFESVDLQVSKVEFKDLEPPTHFQTNEVTWVFQEIVNTYGVPTY
jgi:vacuolar-type H+-ATPase subunit I/STV1